MSGVAVRGPGRWLVEMNTRLFRSFGLTATSGWPLSRAGSFVTLTSVIALPDVPDVAAVCAPADAGKTRTTAKLRNILRPTAGSRFLTLVREDLR